MFSLESRTTPGTVTQQTSQRACNNAKNGKMRYPEIKHLQITLKMREVKERRGNDIGVQKPRSLVGNWSPDEGATPFLSTRELPFQLVGRLASFFWYVDLNIILFSFLIVRKCIWPSSPKLITSFTFSLTRFITIVKNQETGFVRLFKEEDTKIGDWLTSSGSNN